MQLKEYFERYQKINLQSKQTGWKNWVRNYTDPWQQAVVHYFLINYPQIDYTRIELVIKTKCPSDALNRELKEIKEQRGY